MNQERKNEIRDHAMRTDLVDSSAVLELLDEIDRLEGVNNDWKAVIKTLNSDFEEGKTRNDRMAAALRVLSQISMCRPCGAYNQNIIDQIDEMTKEKV